jgi:hypothetical protein
MKMFVAIGVWVIVVSLSRARSLARSLHSSIPPSLPISLSSSLSRFLSHKHTTHTHSTLPGLDWWPIKAFRPCPTCEREGRTYQRRGQGLNEVLFGVDDMPTNYEVFLMFYFYFYFLFSPTMRSFPEGACERSLASARERACVCACVGDILLQQR